MGATPLPSEGANACVARSTIMHATTTAPVNTPLSSKGFGWNYGATMPRRLQGAREEEQGA